MSKERPIFCTDEMLAYLDELRDSEDTNMFGAATYLDAEFPELGGARQGHLSSRSAREILSYWMDSFAERYAKEKKVG